MHLYKPITAEMLCGYAHLYKRKLSFIWHLSVQMILFAIACSG